MFSSLSYLLPENLSVTFEIATNTTFLSSHMRKHTNWQLYYGEYLKNINEIYKMIVAFWKDSLGGSIQGRLERADDRYYFSLWVNT